MKKSFLLVLVIIGIALNSCSKEKVNTENIQSTDNLLELLPDPPAEYRTAPLWDWNDRINKEDIVYQLNKFKEGGLGGVFVHPRPGLVTDYLSDDWNELFQFTVKTGKELGMYVWIYDENSYPSGFAGGHVQDRFSDSYQNGTGLGILKTSNLADTSELVVESILQKDGESEYYIFYRTYPQESWWYGGFPYVDLLYPGVTDTFMKVTMEGYERYFGEEFGKTVPGVFTDEPNLPAAKGPKTAIRWTPDLFEQFEKRWGYKMQDHLISLVDEYGDWKRVRHNYHELMLELFLDRWAVPWNKYCEEKNLDWTGHYWEHGWPIPGEGYDEAAFYMYHQMPGVDMLGRYLCEDGMCQQFGNIRAVRELASAANQAGAVRRFSETYGGAGWQVSFTELKRLVDWECVLGVNFVNQHLSYFSMQGVRKMDYPPSFSYQEPWWDQHKLLGDYTARISMALSAGEQINPVLVLQPNTTAWMYHADADRQAEVNELSVTFKKFIMQLESRQLEYDLGSEQVLRRFGSNSADGLKVGERNYKKVVIPPGMENLDSSTLKLLKDQTALGLELLILSDSVRYLDGKSSPGLIDLELSTDNIQKLDAGNSQQIFEWFNQEDLLLETSSGNPELVFHQRRILNDGELLFIVNSSSDQPAEVSLDWAVRKLARINLTTGHLEAIEYQKQNNRITSKISLPPSGSIMLISNPPTGKLESNERVPNLLFPTTKAQIERLDQNILTIDYLDLETKDFKLDDMYFMNAMYKLFEWSELPTGNPWQHKIQFKQTYVDLDQFDESTWHKIRYHFDVHAGLSSEQMKSMRLVVERPDIWSVSINGHPIQPIAGEWWLDRHFPVYTLRGFVKPGQNTIELSAKRMSVFAEIMPVYILGDFDLREAEKGFTIIPTNPDKAGFWADNGWPFYSGQVSYRSTFSVEKIPTEAEGYWIQFGNWKGSSAELWVNDQRVEIIGWQEKANIAAYLNEGENVIDFRITGSLKNTLGFHHKDLSGWIDGPFSWNQAPEHQPAGGEYRFMDYGVK